MAREHVGFGKYGFLQRLSPAVQNVSPPQGYENTDTGRRQFLLDQYQLAADEVHSFVQYVGGEYRLAGWAFAFGSLGFILSVSPTAALLAKGANPQTDLFCLISSVTTGLSLLSIGYAQVASDLAGREGKRFERLKRNTGIIPSEEESLFAYLLARHRVRRQIKSLRADGNAKTSACTFN